MEGINKRVGDYIGAFFLNIVPILFSISCVIPVVWLFFSTLKTSAQFESSIIALPTSFNLTNYKYVFETTPISRYIWNTLRNTAIILFLVLFFGFTNGYFLARFRFKLRTPLFGFYVSNLFIPIHALLVPTYIMFSFIGLTNKWYSTILPVASMELPVTIFLVTEAINSSKRTGKRLQLTEAVFQEHCFISFFPSLHLCWLLQVLSRFSTAGMSSAIL